MREITSLLLAVVLGAIPLSVDAGSVSRNPSLASLHAAVEASAKSVVTVGKHTAAGKAPAWRPITVQGATNVTPYLQKKLDAMDLRLRHRQLSAAVLGMLEPSCQKKLKTFSVLYGNPAHRGLAGNGVIIVSGEVDDAEFIGLLMHEGLGHFRDITCVTGTARGGRSVFKDGNEPVWNDDPSAKFYAISWKNENNRKSVAKRDDFVTGYAHDADSFEDLAESVTYFMTQEQAFRERARTNSAMAAKLRWLETYMPKTAPIAQRDPWDGTIAWDATKLGFTWHGVAE